MGQSINANSWNEVLLLMQVGERRYYETTPERYGHDMRVMNVPVSRRPDYMRSRKFTTTLFTAVGSPCTNIRYIICLERVE